MNKVVVLFEVKLTKEGAERYLELAEILKPLLADFDGFIRAERFTSLNEEGKLLSMNVWESEEAVSKWRNMVQHRLSQAEGREKLIEDYKITVTSVLREYGIDDRKNAPKDSNDYFGI